MTADLDERSTAGPAPVRRRRRWLVPLLAVLLLVQMAAAMVTTAVQQTPTIDEPVYVGTAVTYLEQHSLRYNPEHPPLGKLLMAAGLAFASPELDPAFRGDQTALGRHVLYEAGNDPYELMLLARLPIILLTLLFGLVVFAFARDLTGPAGGVLALALYAFSPDVITHGSLATLDVPAIGFLLTAVWLTWRARTGARTPLLLALAGVALGAALATRMSVLPAVPVVLLLALLATPAWRRRVAAGERLRGLALAAGVGVVAVGIVWLAYLAVDPGLRWTPPAGLPDEGLRGLLTGLLPLPEAYRDGMRIQFAFEDSTFSGFLFGRHYQGSLWYYLPAALLVKTPLGMLALWVVGAVAMLAVPRLRPAAPYVLVVPALLLAVAMTGARDFGTRYAIFMPMFLAVAAAAVVAVRWRRARLTAGVLVVLVAVSSLRTFPYYLPYSNEAFGGPTRTHLRLHDSNVDWGQDLGRLADRLREKYPGEPVWLVYKGAGVPEAYGISARNPLKAPEEDVHGLLVVSDSSIAKATGRLAALLRTSGEPIDEVGHSIRIFRRP
ncbi:phospholipid carrier-dependent glycosyltransferase [Couchioplanes caeruleus]|uniref:Phospholipid carrier-dependent glycosyltransferase n=2 Tax=Couchioplanes caeruleus TaxID=56438 RepID=A0A1K0FH16_9ACTN|nr:phospholipid carrier-dependent glycosyltransferase [Couchioplanes caeruleus]OJF12016.1 phospholipid carrier-dependent glycosyltransferase [Couchioplanes caeruleus subsp. caeruleus]ROP27381.1 dolichyl-phosphate-mannose-protein mannosyltransferase [Couchioplanes caeruleus]